MSILGSYGLSDAYQLGEFCLVSPSPKKVPGVKRRRLLFVSNGTAFAISSTSVDVSSFAQYLDKKFTELTKELNSPPALRKWTFMDEEPEIEAKYVSATETSATLEKKDGETVTVERAKLSKKDQLYVQRRVEIAEHEAKEKVAEKEK